MNKAKEILDKYISIGSYKSMTQSKYSNLLAAINEALEVGRIRGHYDLMEVENDKSS